jgi:hypothetical protein
MLLANMVSAQLGMWPGKPLQTKTAFSALEPQRIIGNGKLRIVKSGPFLGVEKGKYFNVNFGVERQWQQLKLIKPQTHAVNLQFDYNFKQNVMGSQLGYWFKIGRLNMTYGARISWRTDLEAHHRFGISPNVGYKFMQAHFQLGVHVLTPDDHFENVNTFYASLRWVFINERKFKK